MVFLFLLSVLGNLGGGQSQAETRIEWCGRLASFQPPSATQPGSIQIGERLFLIAPAPAAAGEKFPAPTLLGQAVCIALPQDGQGRLRPDLTYGLQLTAMGSALCGVVVSYSPPGAASSGQIRLSGGNGDGVLLLLGSNYAWPAALTQSQVCMKVGVDSSGRAIAIGPADPAAQPAADRTSNPAALPNTATEEWRWMPLSLLAILVASTAAALVRVRERGHARRA